MSYTAQILIFSVFVFLTGNKKLLLNFFCQNLCVVFGIFEICYEEGFDNFNTATRKNVVKNYRKFKLIDIRSL